MNYQMTGRAIVGGVIGCSFGVVVMTTLTVLNPSRLAVIGAILSVWLEYAMCLAAWKWWRTF